MSSLGNPQITRGTNATTLPPVASSSLAMWCSMSLSSPFPPPLPPPPRTLTYPLCFPLTRWSRHLCLCFLQVLLRRAPRRGCAPARRSPVTPLGLYPARVSRGPLSDRPLRTTRVLGRRLTPAPPACFAQPVLVYHRVPTTRVPDRRLRPHRHASPSRCVSTSGVPSWRRCLRQHWWPPLRRGHLRQRRRPLRRRHRHHSRGPPLPGSRCRCTIHRLFTDTRVMFTLW